MQGNGAAVVHAIAGRLRVKLPALRQNAQLAHELRDGLQAIDGVREVQANPATGSLLLRYEPHRLEQPEFRGQVAEHLGPHVPHGDVEDPDWWTKAASPRSVADGPAPPLAERFGGFFSRLNARFEDGAGRGNDLKALVPLGLLALAFGKLLFGERSTGPSWYELVWFSFCTFLALNPQFGPQPGEAAAAGQEHGGSAAGRPEGRLQG